MTEQRDQDDPKKNILDTQLQKISLLFDRLINRLCQIWRSLPTLKKVFWRFVIYTSLGMLAISWNPFGLNDLAENRSQDAISKIISPFYPFSIERHPEKIIVLLVNGPSLDLISQLPAPQRLTFANEWPILYKDHSNILKTIAANSKPKQIFIDIEFHKIRNTDQSFNELIRTLGILKEKKSILLLHALGSPDEQIPKDINLKLSKYSTPVFNAWASHSMPLYQRDDSNSSIFSPALQMFSNLQSVPVDLQNFSDEMYVFWDGYFDHKKYQYDEPGCPMHDDAVGKLSRSWTYFKNLMLWGEDKQKTCYPQRVVYLDELQQLLNQGAEGKQKIKDLFDNSSIFYGADYVSLGDKVNSPVHGTIPGVFYHSMALDNLLEYEKGYFRVFGDYFDYVIWTVLSMLLAVAMIGRDRVAFIAEHRKLIIILILVLYIFSVIFMTVFWHIAPANVLGAFGLVALVWLLFKKEEECSGGSYKCIDSNLK